MENEKNNRKDEIIALVENYYHKNKFLQTKPLEVYINKAIDKYLNTDLTIEEIDRKIHELIMEMLRDEMMKPLKIEEDNKKDKSPTNRKEEFIQLINQLNNSSVDYALLGYLVGMLLASENNINNNTIPEVIEIAINENDYDKFVDLCNKQGFTTLNINEAMNILEKNDLKIQIDKFKKLNDGSIIMDELFQKDSTTYCKKDLYNPELSSEYFGRNVINFEGIPLKTASPEYIYLSLRNDYDLSFLNNKISTEKIIDLLEKEKTGKKTEIKPLENSVKQEAIPKTENSSDDLNNMINDNSKKDNTQKAMENKSKALVKTNNQPYRNNNQQGYTSSNVILGVIELIIILILLGLLIII